MLRALSYLDRITYEWKLRLSSRLFWLIHIALLVLFTASFVLVAEEVVENDTLEADLAMIRIIQGDGNQTMAPAFRLLTELGSRSWLGSITIVGVLLLAWKRKRREAVLLAVGLIGGIAINKLLKLTFLRDRPDLQRLIEETGYSFPSGHSMNAIIVFGMLAYLAWSLLRRRSHRVAISLMMGMLIVLIGVSRIYLGVHYPTDVAAGFAAGGVWLTVCIGWLKFTDR